MPSGLRADLMGDSPRLPRGCALLGFPFSEAVMP